MVLHDFVAQAGGVGVEINLCGADRLMAQHGLDGAEVGAALQQRGGKRMAEGVGTHRLMDPRFFHQLFQEMEHHDSRDVFLPFADEHKILISWLDVDGVAVDEI